MSASYTRKATFYLYLIFVTLTALTHPHSLVHLKSIAPHFYTGIVHTDMQKDLFPLIQSLYGCNASVCSHITYQML